jgi:hypothetical protein
MHYDINKILNFENYLDIYDNKDIVKYLINARENPAQNNLRQLINYIENHKYLCKYEKYDYICKIAFIVYKNYDLKQTIDVLNIAILYSNPLKLYNLATDYYLLTKDKKFSTELYKKNIELLFKAKNTTTLSLLAKSMCNIDVKNEDFFSKWGGEIMIMAKEMKNQ